MPLSGKGLMSLASDVIVCSNMSDVAMIGNRIFPLSKKAHHILCRLKWARQCGKVGLRQLVMNKKICKFLKRNKLIVRVPEVKLGVMKTHQAKESSMQVLVAS